MRDSPGKQTARAVFWQTCCLDWIPPEILRSTKVLVLLGDIPEDGTPPLEIPYIDAHGIPRDNVISIEHHLPTYLRQQRARLGVHLHYREATDYLRFQLNSELKLGILNLDIEGSYLNQLDASMCWVLLFCRRNPQTVVATYSSRGRDLHPLYEGVAAYALLHALAPEATESAAATLLLRYQQTHIEEPARMVLRNFFWARSLLEHALDASCRAGATPKRAVNQLLAVTQELWGALRVAHHAPLLLEHLRTVSQDATRQLRLQRLARTPLRFGIQLERVRHLLYLAMAPWSQLCHFMKFVRRTELTSPTSWVEDLLSRLTEAPLTFIDREGVLHEYHQVSTAPPPAQTLIWHDHKPYASFSPRAISSPGEDAAIAAIQRDIDRTYCAERK